MMQGLTVSGGAFQVDEAIIAVARAEALTIAGLVAMSALVIVFFMLRMYSRKDGTSDRAVNALITEVQTNREALKENSAAFNHFLAASERHTRALQQNGDTLVSLIADVQTLKTVVDVLPDATAAQVSGDIKPLLEILMATLTAVNTTVEATRTQLAAAIDRLEEGVT
jgi:hypothetical protein